MKVWKTILPLLAVLSLLAVLTVSATAAQTPSCFVGSATYQSRVEVVSAPNDSPDCHTKLVVTSWVDRGELEADDRNDFVKAYENLTKYDTPVQACSALSTAVSKKGIAAVNTAVSEFVDLTYTTEAGHDQHGTFTITLQSENFRRYLGIMQYEDGEWVLIDSTFDSKNLTVTFRVKDLGPVAVVVEKAQSPKTGDRAWLTWGSVLTVAVAAAVVTLVLRKKTCAE